MENSYKQSPIITTDQLESILNEENVKILDCSSQMARNDCSRINFLKSHIKGAQYLDIDNLRDKSTELPFMLPDEKTFSDRMKVLNVKLTDRIICYDTGDMQFFGYRAAWMFQAMNHQNVQVLDGGFKKWVAEKKQCESTDQNVKESDFDYKIQPMKLKVRKQIEEFQDNPQSRTYQLIDSRPPEMFSQGSIEGSVHIPATKLLNQETKTLKTPQERKAIFEEAGVDLSKDIALTCQSGIAATFQYGALKDICTGRLSVYDGSWSEFKHYAK